MDRSRDVLTFGDFRLFPDRRELLSGNTPVKLGNQTFELLMALVESPGTVLSKDALLTRVWPDRDATDNILQGQISALRVALGPERVLIGTVNGRGYQFSGGIRIMSQAEPRSDMPAEAMAERTNLPQPFSDLVGREREVDEIAGLLRARRFVTLTGPGGVGKTRLAFEVAHRLLQLFPDGVWLAEFSPLTDPGLVPATVAKAIGLGFGGELTVQRLAQALAGRRALVVLDTCEHLLDAVAPMAEAAVQVASSIHIIATSRESLRVKGEVLYPVASLAVPPYGGADIMDFGAARLFVERAREAGAELTLNCREAEAIAAICRSLDGLPLAIEMAAARVAAIGVQELAEHLVGSYRLLTGGRRTAPQRQQTMRETLAWSYNLLSGAEQIVLRRLAIFAGSFNLNAAAIVAACDEVSPTSVINGLTAMVDKSLIVAEIQVTIPRYRLLDTTRAYALERLRESEKYTQIARCHAEYQHAVLIQARTDWNKLSAYSSQLDDVRAALDWAFSIGGDVTIGVALTVNAVSLWLRLSLAAECAQRVEYALRQLGQAYDPSRRYKMELQAAWATTIYYTKGIVPEIVSAFRTTLEIAKDLGDAEFQWQALYGLWLYHLSVGDFVSAEAIGTRFSDLARRFDASQAIKLVGDRLVAVPMHFRGNLAGARQLFDHLLDRPAETIHRPHIVCYQHDQRLESQASLARILWLQGFPTQALQLAQKISTAIGASDHRGTLGFTLTHTRFQVALFCGDLDQAEQYADLILAQSVTFGIALWSPHASGARGKLLVKQGRPSEALGLLNEALDGLARIRFYIFQTILLGARAEALGATGLINEGLEAVDEALVRAERNGEGWYLPELLRIGGELALSAGDSAAAQRLFARSLSEARRIGALSWELRTATSLARLQRNLDGVARLRAVYDRFTEGFDTADLREARTLL